MEDKKQTLIYLPDWLRVEIKIEAAKTGRTMSQVVEDVMRRHFEKSKNKGLGKR